MNHREVQLKPDESRLWPALAALASYAVLTIGLTWPVAAGLARDVPSDLGDPLLNAWILAWDATHLGQRWWNANIFHPHPLALAYSEHLLPQAIQILPFYAATKNPILCYNLVFLSTFSLSGLGMFLFARELTGNRAAAFVAGLAYAFAPYRIASLPHLHVLSSAWMPFALFGFRRYFETGRARPLAGGSLAWILQNLSSGYYLFYFSPVVLIYMAWELTIRRRWLDARTMARLAIAVVAVGGATASLAVPYFQLRQLGFGPRALVDVEQYSADVYAYLTADPKLRVWGSIARGWDKQEGALFPGLTIVVLSVVGVTRSLQANGDDRRHSVEGRTLRAAAVVFFAAACALLVALLLGWSVRSPMLKITSVSRLLALTIIAGALVLAVSTDVRRRLGAWLASPVAVLLLVTILAIVMSFGPDIHSRGRQIAEWSLYEPLYRHVPGFDGLRVPARFGMIVALGLAALGAYGVRRPRSAVIVGALIVIESLAIPLPINENDTNYKQAHLAPLPGRVSAPDVAALYQFIAGLPEPCAIVELPLGEPAFDVRYVFYSTLHWKRIVNGYSGGAPVEYETLNSSLQEAIERPDRAWQAILRTQPTHAIVHEAYYAGGRGRAISDWLRVRGAQEIATFGTDRVFVIH